jgi:acetone carboxylase gamma subunit
VTAPEPSPEDRRAAGKALARMLSGNYRCPHCDAETDLEEREPGYLLLHVYHDETCPFLARMDGRR